MAILGEVSCLSAAIVALPAFVVWSQRRRSTNGASGLAQPAPDALGEAPVEPSSLSAPSASE
jgi:hypothetical protein